MTKHERRHSGFKLDLLTIVEKDVSVDLIIGLQELYLKENGRHQENTMSDQ